MLNVTEKLSVYYFFGGWAPFEMNGEILRGSQQQEQKQKGSEEDGGGVMA